MLKKYHCIDKILFGLVTGLMCSSVLAGIPVWRFTPLTPTTFTGASDQIALVKYRVTNQSTLPHTLVINAIPGVTQITDITNSCSNPFVLPHKGSFCDLTLRIDRLTLTQSVIGGPIVCEQGNVNQCYRPRAADLLHISPAQEIVAYVTSLNGNSVYQCSILPDGNFDSCSIAGSDIPTPYGIGTHASMMYVGSLFESIIRRCTLDALGNFMDCIPSTVPNGPNGFTFTNSEKRIYIASTGSNSIAKCDIDSEGALVNCTSAGGTGFSVPATITLNHEGNVAYISNRGNGTIRQCRINSIGNLFACVNAAVGFTMPVDVTLNSLGDRAYVLTTSPGRVFRCDVNPDATFSNCVATGTVSSPRFLVFNADETQAYITNTAPSNFVSLCDVDSAGALQNCAQTGPNITGATGIQLVAR